MTEKLTAELAVVEPTSAANTTFPVPPDPTLPELPDLPVSIRSLSLIVLAGLGCVFVLHWAAAVFIPSLMIAGVLGTAARVGVCRSAVSH